MLWSYSSYPRTDSSQKNPGGIQELESKGLKSKVEFCGIVFESSRGEGIFLLLRLSMEDGPSVTKPKKHKDVM